MLAFARQKKEPVVPAHFPLESVDSLEDEQQEFSSDFTSLISKEQQSFLPFLPLNAFLKKFTMINHPPKLE
jgi:hypothetical protein